MSDRPSRIGTSDTPEIRFGHFVVRQRPDGALWELGRGAMGVTYRAVDPQLGKEVALKVIRSEKELDEAARRRFQREARAAAQIDQLNVAAVHHFGEQDGALFYAMEFIHGQSLETVLTQNPGPWPPVAALALMAQAAAALKAAHKTGVIHRDLKPANMMIISGGDLKDENERTAAAGHRLLKVIDFGLARRFGESAETGATMATAGFFGTAAYSSPEQCREDPQIDDRSDLYGLGITLWQLLAGQMPFGGSLHDVLTKQLTVDPPVEQLSALPVAVRKLVLGLLAKDPAQREPQTAAELVVILDQLWRELAGSAPPSITASAAATVEDEAPNFARVEPNREPIHHELETVLESRGAYFPWEIPPPGPVRRRRRRLKTIAILTLVGCAAIAYAVHFRKFPVTLPFSAASSAGSTNPIPASKDAPFVNSLGMQFVPAGTIGVLFSKWDTRVKDFETYVAETHEEPGKPVYSLGKEQTPDGSYMTDHGNTWRSPGFSQTLNDPVVGVSWHEANAFCAWLSKKEGRTYRLPTDEEWERAVGSAKYPWGKSWPPKAVDGNYASEEAKDKNWPDDFSVVPGLKDGHGRTSPVGIYHANAWGLYDMGGNVWQWCADAHGSEGNPSQRIMRGASWSSYDESMFHSNYRGQGPANHRRTNVGFRCVIAASGGK